MENKKSIITKYYGVITKGDELHEAGEKHYFHEAELETTIKFGLRIYESKWGSDGANIYYPCKIYVETYELVSQFLVDATEAEKVGYSPCKSKYDWRDHWC